MSIKKWIGSCASVRVTGVGIGSGGIPSHLPDEHRDGPLIGMPSRSKSLNDAANDPFLLRFWLVATEACSPLAGIK
jgi:hypothetical protein